MSKLPKLQLMWEKQVLVVAVDRAIGVVLESALESKSPFLQRLAQAILGQHRPRRLRWLRPDCSTLQPKPMLA